MSMKRTKPVSRGRRDTDEGAFFSKKPPEKTYKWDEDVAGQPDESFVPYALTSHFARGALVSHTKFGKGVVTHVEGPRVDVLFQEIDKYYAAGKQLTVDAAAAAEAAAWLAEEEDATAMTPERLAKLEAEKAKADADAIDEALAAVAGRRFTRA